MKRILVGLVALSFLASLSGCVFVDRKPARSSKSVSRAKCHPSQYWDGHKCKHKGKGHGARKHKHDGR
jgi:hypothetical protein